MRKWRNSKLQTPNSKFQCREREEGRGSRGKQFKVISTRKAERGVRNARFRVERSADWTDPPSPGFRRRSQAMARRVRLHHRILECLLCNVWPVLFTILLVENDANYLETLKIALRKNGINNPLQCVSNGEEALDYICGKGKYGNRNDRLIVAHE
jgi:hypothetical protein